MTMERMSYVTRDEFANACGGRWAALRMVLGWPVGHATARLAAMLLAADSPERKHRIGGPTLAKLAHMDRTTAGEALRELKRLGLLKIVAPSGRGTRWLWRNPALPV